MALLTAFVAFKIALATYIGGARTYLLCRNCPNSCHEYIAMSGSPRLLLPHIRVLSVGPWSGSSGLAVLYFLIASLDVKVKFSDVAKVVTAQAVPYFRFM